MRARLAGWLSLLPWLAVLVFVAAVLLWVGSDRESAAEAHPPYSALRTGPEGLSLARAWLEDGKRSVALLAAPLGPESAPSDAVVLRIAPRLEVGFQEMMRRLKKSLPTPTPSPSPLPAAAGSATPSPAPAASPTPEDSDQDLEPDVPARAPTLLTEREESWVRSGGRLVLAIDGDYGPIGTRRETVANAIERVFPIWKDVNRIAPPEPRVLGRSGLERAQSLFVRGGAVVLSRLRLGQGEVYVCSAPELFANAHLGEADHLALLQALAPPGRRVLFDEYLHGLEREGGVVALLGSWRLGPLLVLGALAALIGWWRHGTRIGPPDEEWQDRRSEAVDMVDSLAGLYDRALRRDEAIAMWYKSLVSQVVARTGARSADVARRARELANGFTPRKPGGKNENKQDIAAAEFRHSLDTINQAFRRLDHVHPRRHRGPLG